MFSLKSVFYKIHHRWKLLFARRLLWNNKFWFFSVHLEEISFQAHNPFLFYSLNIFFYQMLPLTCVKLAHFQPLIKGIFEHSFVANNMLFWYSKCYVSGLNDMAFSKNISKSTVKTPKNHIPNLPPFLR